MPPSNDIAWLKPFLSGIVVAAATIHLLPRFFDHSCSNSNNNGKSSSSSKSSSKSNNEKSCNKSSSSSPSSNIIMDSPKLDQRVLRKAEGALQNRTSRLIVVVERCTNDHNYSAILRTVEALGIQHVYIIDPQACNSTLKVRDSNTIIDNGDDIGDGDNNAGDISDAVKESIDASNGSKDSNKNMKLYRSTGQQVKQCSEAEVKDRAQHHLFAKKALEWLDVREFETTGDCITELQSKGYKIWSTDLSQVAVCLTRDGLLADDVNDNDNVNTHNNTIIPEKLAIVFGTEAVGCTAEMLHSSDKRVYLPLRGFADSLNLSVATALVIHQLFTLDPTLIGSMSNDERIGIRRKWYSKLASQRLLSKSVKNKRRRLTSQITYMTKLERRMNQPNDGEAPLTKEQLIKLKNLPSMRAELKAIEDDIQQKSLLVVEDLVNDPPKPLGDMRRADEHRTTFAGKNTKKNHGTAWVDMPATGYYRTEDLTSASFFRDRLKHQGDGSTNN